MGIFTNKSIKIMSDEFKLDPIAKGKGVNEKECRENFENSMEEAYKEEKDILKKLKNISMVDHQLDLKINSNWDRIDFNLNGEVSGIKGDVFWTQDGQNQWASFKGKGWGIFFATFEFGFSRAGSGFDTKLWLDRIVQLSNILNHGLKIKGRIIKQRLLEIAEDSKAEEVPKHWMEKYADLF